MVLWELLDPLANPIPQPVHLYLGVRVVCEVNLARVEYDQVLTVGVLLQLIIDFLSCLSQCGTLFAVKPQALIPLGPTQGSMLKFVCIYISHNQHSALDTKATSLKMTVLTSWGVLALVRLSLWLLLGLELFT